MIPRGTPDIGWRDLAAGLLGCVWSDRPERVQRRVEARWSAEQTVACLSVRSGLDLLLQALALPRGSELIVSAITIPDMITIIERHGLTPVPVDLDPATLGVDPARLAQAIGPRTRAILVAHLFGSRMPLAPAVRLARQHGLLLIEDCAQAYDGAYRGDPDSDACLFSFGPIKTATALGGALVHCQDAALAARLRQLQARYPRQPRWLFVRRIARFAALKLLAHPQRFAVFVALCRLRRRNHDQLINEAVRGFAGQNLLARIRLQPSAALLQLLERRLRQFDPARIEARAAFARRVLAQIPAVARPGAAAERHTHWVLPIESDDPETLTRVLWAHGFDATRKASSLTVVPPPDQRTPDPLNARRLLARLVYLPMYPQLGARDLLRLGQIVRDVERAPQLDPPVLASAVDR
jgi:dTDP-4-amino-4,6-dideoxygalactose transaminase